MTCSCDRCPAKGTAKCPKEQLEFDAHYFKDLLDKAEN